MIKFRYLWYGLLLVASSFDSRVTILSFITLGPQEQVTDQEVSEARRKLLLPPNWKQDLKDSLKLCHLMEGD